MDVKQAKYAKYGMRGFSLKTTCRRVQQLQLCEGITMTPKRAHGRGREYAYYGLVTALLHTDVESKLLSMAKVKNTCVN